MDRQLYQKSKPVSFQWLLKMAWRDSRSNRGKLTLFTLSIVLGLASLVGINSFKENMQDEINKEAKSLLGADLEISSRQPWTTEQLQLMDSLNGDWSWQVRFASMVFFTKSQGTRLVQVRALSGLYPYYGQIETEPVWAGGDLQNGDYALVDEKLMLQFNAAVGDKIKIGESTYTIHGKLRGVPGQSGMSTSVSPIVYIPGASLMETGLIQKGSRVVYSRFYQLEDISELDPFLENKKDRLENLDLKYATVQTKKSNTSQAFNNLTTFLNLATFIALLLGSVGVGSAVFIYLRDKRESVAILRCLGLKGREAFYIFLIQVVIMGMLGSTVGCSLGVILQFYMPTILKDVLPVSITPHVYWQVPFMGLLLGLTITVLFAALPLISLSKVSPLVSIRQAFEQNGNNKNLAAIGVYALMAVLLYFFSFFQIRDWLEAGYFVLGLAIAFGMLWLLSQGLMKLARLLGSQGLNFVLRQGIANLYRPNNQTTILMLTIGLCATLLATVMLTRVSLLDEIKLADAGERPNMVLFDIQTDQKEELKSVTTNFGLPVIQDVPVVTMRLMTINGVSKKQAKKDTTDESKDWAYNREYRVTFRDTLTASEKLVDGSLKELKDSSDSIFVSVSKGLSESLELKIGDELTWNVQGAILKTYIGSFRKIDWRRVQTNFLVLFPEGVLEEAPQFHVLVTRVDNAKSSAKFQQAIVKTFPNISVIDLDLILKTVEDILGQISYIINFMALITALTSGIVLIGSMVLSIDHRVRESVLLRTLGANSKKILLINFVEYLTLGGIGALSGVALSNLLTYLLMEFVMQGGFIFSLRISLILAISIALSTVIIGLMNIRTVLGRSPLEVLRRT